MADDIVSIGWKDGAENIRLISLMQTFGLEESDPEKLAVLERVKISVLDAETSGKTDPDYWFDKVLLKKMLRWVYGLSARRNVMLIGDAGTGKSSLFLELAARLNFPVYQMACSGKTRFQHLVGSRELIKGETVWVDGPLTKAMRGGGIFLMDEVTRMDPGEQMNLAAVLDERSALTIPDTGEIIHPHPLFRVAATGNSAGFGDESGAYIGEKPSSFAFIDRFQKIIIPTLPEEVEARILKKAVPNLTDDIIGAMVKFANAVRTNFVGNGGALSFTMSPRSVRVWALEAWDYRSMYRETDKSPVLEALNDTILNGVPKDNRKTAIELFDQWFT